MEGEDEVVVEMALGYLLGGVFLVSAVPKLRHPEGFVLTVLQYEVLYPALAYAYARILPVLELFLGLMLITGIAMRLAAVGLGFLLVTFLVGTAINLARGRELECGCFGGARKIGPSVLVQEVGLLGCASLIAASERDWFDVASWSWLEYARMTVSEGTAVCLATALLSAVIFGTVARKSRVAQGKRERPADVKA